ncbi:TPA: hypothetical protein HA238_04525 [Candidatus Micrarchaeota archaeon]|nr:hypothetical protein [Candidatus Micrarchaeota archaeon]
MVSDDELKASILHRLAKKRKWGESHTAFENVARGVPPHLKGKFKELAEELVKEGFIFKKPTGYGLQISLNVGRSDEIKYRIRKYFELEII